MPQPDALPPRTFGLPLVGNTLGIMRDPIDFQRRGHRRHGPVFSARIFGTTLTFVDPVGAPQLFEQVIRTPPDQLSLVAAYKHLVGRILEPELFTEIDKSMREGLSVKYIGKHVAPTVAFVPQVLARRLPGDHGTLDGLRMANDVVLHVVAHYVLGHGGAERHADELAEAMHVLESDFSILGMMLPIETASARRRRAAFDRMMGLIEAEVRARLADRGEHDDFLQFAIDHMSSGEGAEKDDIRWLGLRVLGTIFGAHTNTAMSVASTLSDLVEHPEALARVRAEIAALPADAPMDLAAMRTLVHLHRAINESMRLRSNGGLWRMAMCDLDLGGYKLPKGTVVGASMGLVNLDPARYDGSHEYRPARFEAMATDNYQSPSVGSTPLQFGAFGTGRNLCSGRPLAYAMLAAILVPLLRDYEWEVVARPRRWFTLLTGGLSRPIGGLTLRYRRRVSPPRA
ncbi:cytochrome P450 [Nannocystis pusilla]|uniref:cytochrome P450 n=1 Tax=Nannocystis pusilla TaxID=889268 RepID=UPI003BF3C30C